MAQLDFIQRVWMSLTEQHQGVQVEILDILIVKLETAKSRLDGLLKKQTKAEAAKLEKPAVKRWKYFFLKPYLDDAIRSLDKWQKQYDPSWFLILRVASPVIDRELRRESTARPAEGNALLKTATKVRGALNDSPPVDLHIFLPSEGLAGARIENIPHSSAKFVQRAGKAGWFVVDSVPYLPGSYLGLVTADIRKLATKLHCADPSTFGLLKCRGVLKKFSNNGTRLTSFEMVFEPPSTDRPCTLRTCLITRKPHTLTERLDLAKQMAGSVNYVHTLDFVHKNLRPENMLGFNGTDSELGSFFLIGFQQVRSADGITYFAGDEAWEKNLHRHPGRQGPFPEEAYRMQHDICSLGVCLLEIGL